MTLRPNPTSRQGIYLRLRFKGFIEDSKKEENYRGTEYQNI